MKPPSLFKPREKFLVLEIMPSGVNGMFLFVDEDRNLVFEKLLRGIDLKTFFGSPMRRATQQSWEGEYLFKAHRKVIAVADSSIATTIPIPVDLMREPSDAKSEITVPELENLIAQEMAKIFNQCRSEASARLGIHELDTMLVGEKARGFRVDGNTVMNPAGFAGKKISLLLELTFTNRTIFETLKQFFNAPEDFFFGESAQIRLSSLARVRKLPINLIFCEEGERKADSAAALFVLENTKGDHPVLYREPFHWNFDSLFARICGEFNVSRSVAEELYEMHAAGKFSDAAGRAFKKVIDPSVEELLREVEKKKLKGPVFLDAPHAAPFPLPYRHEGAAFEEFPLEEVMNSLGFRSVQNNPLSGHALSRHLLPFLEAYFDKTNIEINQKLRRRLHWLAV